MIAFSLDFHRFFRTSRTMIDPTGHPFCLDTEEAE